VTITINKTKLWLIFHNVWCFCSPWHKCLQSFWPQKMFLQQVVYYTGRNVGRQTLKSGDRIPSGADVSRDVFDEKFTKAWNTAWRCCCNVRGNTDMDRYSAITLQCRLHWNHKQSHRHYLTTIKNSHTDSSIYHMVISDDLQKRSFLKNRKVPLLLRSLKADWWYLKSMVVGRKSDGIWWHTNFEKRMHMNRKQRTHVYWL